MKKWAENKPKVVKAKKKELGVMVKNVVEVYKSKEKTTQKEEIEDTKHKLIVFLRNKTSLFYGRNKSHRVQKGIKFGT